MHTATLTVCWPKPPKGCFRPRRPDRPALGRKLDRRSPLLARDGGFIAPGSNNSELDEVRTLANDKAAVSIGAECNRNSSRSPVSSTLQDQTTTMCLGYFAEVKRLIAKELSAPLTDTFNPPSNHSQFSPFSLP